MDFHALTSRLNQRLLEHRAAIRLIGSVGAGVTLYAIVRQIRRHAYDPLSRPSSSISKEVFFSLFAAAAAFPRIKPALLSRAAIFSFGFITVHKFCSWLRARLDPSKNSAAPQLARSSLGSKEAPVADDSLGSTIAALPEEHGPIVCVAPNEYSISGPEALNNIYTHSDALTKICYEVPTQALEQSSVPHVDICTTPEAGPSTVSTFEMASVKQYEPGIDECIDILHDRLTEFVICGDEVNISHTMSSFVWDAFSVITVGKRFGFLDRGEDVAGLIEELENWKSSAVLRGGYWTWLPFIEKASSVIPSSPPVSHSFFYVVNAQLGRRMRPACGETLAKSNQTTEELMSTTLSTLQDTSAQNVLHACLASCCANTDTTAISIASAIYHIYKDPVTLKRMRNHMDAGITAGLVSDHITADEARGMHYLQAVLKEALRMQTSSASSHSWVVTSSGVAFDDHKLPQGSILSVSPSIASNDKSIFGDDAQIFRPERWLEAETEEDLFIMEQYLSEFLQCSNTSQQISFAEMSKVVPMLVRNFDFEVQQASTGSDAWTVDFNNFICKVKLRSSKLGHDIHSKQKAFRKPFEWICSSCKFCNVAYHDSCFRCSSPKANSTMPDDWMCRRCNFGNLAHRNNCYRCRAKKPLDNSYKSRGTQGGPGGVGQQRPRNTSYNQGFQTSSPQNQGSQANRSRTCQQRQHNAQSRPSVPTFAPRSQVLPRATQGPPSAAPGSLSPPSSTPNPQSPKIAKHNAAIAAWGSFRQEEQQRAKVETEQFLKENDARLADLANGVVRESAPLPYMKETFRQTRANANGDIGSRRVIKVEERVHGRTGSKNEEGGVEGAAMMNGDGNE